MWYKEHRRAYADVCKYDKWLEPENLIRIEGWASDGLTEKQIAEDKMHVSLTSLKDWKNKFPPIMTALKRGKEVPDREVENALFKSAIGYERTETVIDSKGFEHTITKWYPPNITAIIFYLKNRKPEQWRDKPSELTISDDGNTGVVILPARQKVDDGT